MNQQQAQNFVDSLIGLAEGAGTLTHEMQDVVSRLVKLEQLSTQGRGALVTVKKISTDKLIEDEATLSQLEKFAGGLGIPPKDFRQECKCNSGLALWNTYLLGHPKLRGR